MKFNEKLKYLRESKKYTQDEIATRLNISRQSVSKWENGINEPDIDTLKKLCQILDCSISDLIDDNNEIVTTKEEKDETTVKKLFYFNIGLFIFSLLLFFVFYRGMSDEIIDHWNEEFVEHYGPRYNALIIILPICLGFGCTIFSRIYCKNKKYYNKYKVSTQIFSLVMQSLITIFVIVVLSLMDEYSTDTIQLIYIGGVMSILCVFSIFAHPRFNKRNPFFGLKTNFTLSSEEAWNKINSFTSLIIGGTSFLSYILLIIIYSTEYMALYILLPVIISLISIVIYHEVIRHKMKNRK